MGREKGGNRFDFENDGVLDHYVCSEAIGIVAPL